MDRQTLRDWVIRFNEQGPDGLINLASPGAPPKLDAEHRAFLSRMVEEGPIPAVHGVVRWRACDLLALLQEEFGISVSDDTIYRALKDQGFAHLSARPKAYRQDAEAMQAFKKRMARPVRKRWVHRNPPRVAASASRWALRDARVPPMDYRHKPTHGVTIARRCGVNIFNAD